MGDNESRSIEGGGSLQGQLACYISQLAEGGSTEGGSERAKHPLNESIHLPIQKNLYIFFEQADSSI